MNPTERIIRAPGRVVVSPTNLGWEYPYGGHELGRVKAAVLTGLGSTHRVYSEALGEATAVLEADNHWIFSCFIRGWDNNAVEHLLDTGYMPGQVTGHSMYNVPGNATPGDNAAARGKVILFVADDVVHAPSCILYNAIPDWADGFELAFQRTEEIGLPLAFDCLRNSNNLTLTVGRFADLTL